MLRLKIWLIAAFLIAWVEIYYFVRGVPFRVNVIDWGIGVIFVIIVTEISLRLVQKELKLITKYGGELDKLKQMYQNVFDLFPEAIFVVDEDGIIIDVNRQVKSWLGYSSEELVRKRISDLPFLSERGRVKARIISQRVRKAGVPPHELEFVTKKGEVRIGIMSVTPIRDKADRLLMNLIVVSDATEQREVDRAKTEFVSLASHQLRTPLSTISWYTEYILREDAGKVTRKQRDYLVEIYRENQRMIKLVNILLSIARIELGSLRFELEEMDLANLIDSVLDELRVQILEKGLQVKKGFQEEILRVRADPEFMRVIVQNLISNAVKYTSKGGVIEISLSLPTEPTYTREKAEGRFVLSVTDTGCGIPPYQQSQIFTKLFRADNVKELGHEGTGLGLYIVKSIVEGAGGEVWFKSKENEGSTFSIELPTQWVEKGSKIV
ncbi:PAS domain S-box protein [Patescibacteria group bacterium]|nr:PAS domain S-box protein [Patescibacteria group bacterium]MBU1867955.1 PAS domain S-box protein [Patescibacteria group bacterium]